MAKLPPHLFGILITTTGVIILSPDGLLIRLVSADSWTILFWRGLLFAIAITGFYMTRRKQSIIARLKVMGRRGMLAAALFTFSTIFFVLAITHTSVANALVIIATAPLFAALFSRLFLNEIISRSTWIAILVCVGGISLIFIGSLGGGSRHGDIFAIVCAFGLAGQITTVRHARDIDMVPSLALSGLLTAAVTLPFAAPLAINGSDFAYLALLGLVIVPVAFGLITVGPRYITAPEVSLLMLLESIFGSFWVWLVLNETPRPETLAGGALVITTLVIHSILGYKRKPPLPLP
ncbi:DMT family transporter [Sneathiella sp.]|uniref:DMT family transporter n=1 Tax=Sneathiella sp. TaxID=1964365 RepID=UPI0035671894